MTTMTFDIPEPLKQEFERMLDGQDPSAVIAEAMREMIERAQRKQRSQEAVASILERRAKMTPVNADDVRAAREALRR